jgi:hypothetical protein
MLSDIARHMQNAGVKIKYQLPSAGRMNGTQPGQLETHLTPSLVRSPEGDHQDQEGNVDVEPIKQPSVSDNLRDAGACLSHGGFDSQRSQDQSEHSATEPDLDNQNFTIPSRPDEAEGVIEDATFQTKSRSHWTLPTKMPKFGPDDFSDPISDKFWNKIWNAGAVHNVSVP